MKKEKNTEKPEIKWRWVCWGGEWRLFLDLIKPSEPYVNVHWISIPHDIAKLIAGKTIPKIPKMKKRRSSRPSPMK